MTESSKNKNKLFNQLLSTFSFLFLLSIYFIESILKFIIKIFPKQIKEKSSKSISTSFYKIYQFFDYSKRSSISKIDIIELAIRSMKSKFARTAITVGGMTIGIGSIVFLVSIGYGLQDMVIKRAVRLDEMRQTDVYPQPGGLLKIDEGVMNSISSFQNVEKVMPLISAVGKINYNGSETDSAIYGVTSDYLSNSALKPYLGEIFESNDLKKDEKVKGVESNTIPKIDITQGKSETFNIEEELVPLSSSAQKEIVVNSSLLKVLGIPESNAIGSNFEISFVIVGDLLDNKNLKIKSVPEKYKIVGVINKESVPLAYVPFIDLSTLGVTKYSQLKVIINKQSSVDIVRKQIEASGFATKSVADTVVQINNIFSTAKTILALFGLIALSVASLGMFNTLTVSLLERTREVGLMKSLGMKSDEVRDLFLAESIVMGFLGGILGLLTGVIGGKLVSLILTILSISRGGDYIDVSYLPVSFVIAIILLSFSVGLLTGFYPAKRATKVSVLNALRFE